MTPQTIQKSALWEWPYFCYYNMSWTWLKALPPSSALIETLQDRGSISLAELLTVLDLLKPKDHNNMVNKR